MRVRRRLRVRGAVQGVGFRPFVFRLAHELALSGWVLNDADGVLIEVEGPATAVAAFEERMPARTPAHARIDAVEAAHVGPTAEPGFEIRPSPSGGSGLAGVLPDLATCPDCLAEVLNPTDRRHRYPFTNCTNCGPRFSILTQLPYDRANTTMATFRMCAACQAEYDDPFDRRFHAQPNACPACGPQLRLDSMRGDAALAEAVRAIRAGRIAAIKGLGGFHLVVDAQNADAVARLRARKRRGAKPFAVMFADVASLERFCDPTSVELRGATSAAAPITLMRSRPDALPEQIAPGNPWIGAMLPYTPLHHLLVADLGGPIVATSGNRAGEPICTDIVAARARLDDIADVFLDHDRPIRRPVEDSVTRQVAGDIVVLRRGRGLAPAPVARCGVDGILGRGAQQKSALAMSRGGAVVLGPHIGDLSAELATIETFETAVADLPALLGTPCGIDVVDLHPDYLSRRTARREMVEVQHHHAHAAACLGEHDIERALAVVWDGTGYGPDGTIWGGEFLDANRASFRRVAHLRQFHLPGGDAAVREPPRQAFAVAHEVGVTVDRDDTSHWRQMVEAGLNAPLTSSAGRLFDAVSWFLGFAPPITSFDGEAAMALEDGAAAGPGADLPTPQLIGGVLDWGPLVLAILESDASPAAVAAGFHEALARAIALVASTVDIAHVALVGGCFQNRRLIESAAAELRAVGRTPIWCRQIPPNDGGLAAGQVIVAAARQQS